MNEFYLIVTLTVSSESRTPRENHSKLKIVKKTIIDTTYPRSEDDFTCVLKEGSLKELKFGHFYFSPNIHPKFGSRSCTKITLSLKAIGEECSMAVEVEFMANTWKVQLNKKTSDLLKRLNINFRVPSDLDSWPELREVRKESIDSSEILYPKQVYPIKKDIIEPVVMVWSNKTFRVKDRLGGCCNLMTSLPTTGNCYKELDETNDNHLEVILGSFFLEDFTCKKAPESKISRRKVQGQGSFGIQTKEGESICKSLQCIAEYCYYSLSQIQEIDYLSADFKLDLPLFWNSLSDFLEAVMIILEKYLPLKVVENQYKNPVEDEKIREYFSSFDLLQNLAEKHYQNLLAEQILRFKSFMITTIIAIRSPEVLDVIGKGVDEFKEIVKRQIKTFKHKKHKAFDHFYFWRFDEFNPTSMFDFIIEEIRTSNSKKQWVTDVSQRCVWKENLNKREPVSLKFVTRVGHFSIAISSSDIKWVDQRKNHEESLPISMVPNYEDDEVCEVKQIFDTDQPNVVYLVKNSGAAKSTLLKIDFNFLLVGQNPVFTKILERTETIGSVCCLSKTFFVFASNSCLDNSGDG